MPHRARYPPCHRPQCCVSAYHKQRYYRAPLAQLTQRFTSEEREALASHDYVKLFEPSTHHFLPLTLFIALFERDYAEPLGFQREYVAKLLYRSLYPDIIRTRWLSRQG